MPIYQCKPGSDSTEPWRHGLPVYALPYPIDSHDAGSVIGRNNSNATQGHTKTGTHAAIDINSNYRTNATTSSTATDSHVQMHQYEDEDTRYTTHTLAGAQNLTASHVNNTPQNPSSSSSSQIIGGGIVRGLPIRRVKHAEIVLVDEISVHYGNYWLRLRWPGDRGGVAGYIALGSVNVVPIATVDSNSDENDDNDGDKNKKNNRVQLSVNLSQDLIRERSNAGDALGPAGE